MFCLSSQSARSLATYDEPLSDKPRSVNDGHVIEPGGRQRQISVAVTSCAFIVAQSFQATMKREKSSSTVERSLPAPSRDLEIGEVGLPELVGRRGLVPELLGRFDDDVSRAGDKIVRS